MHEEPQFFLPKVIRINSKLRKYKEKASELLCSETKTKLRKKRAVDVETVFGDIKRNMLFTRFSLRSIEKVELEFRLIAMGHNIRKIMKKIAWAGA